MPRIVRPFKIVCILPFNNKVHMYYRIIATLALSFIFYAGSSQIQYHRLYETSLNDQMGMMNDTTFYHMSSTTTTGDVYALGTKRVGNENLSLVFTKHNDKGNIDWQKELDLGQDTVLLLNNAKIEFNGAQDSLLFVVNVSIDGQSSSIFGKLDKAGNEIDLRRLGGLTFNPARNLPNVAPFINQSDILLTTGSKPTISRIGLSDDVMWSQAYEFTNTDGDMVLDQLTDIKSTPDSTIILTGITEASDDFIVAELDSNGVQLWAESYALDIADLSQILPTEVIPLSNGNFAVIGDYIIDASSNSFISIIDTAGSIVLTKEIVLDEDLVSVRNLVEAQDGTIWISGVYTSSDSIQYFTTNMNIEGSINWTTIYGEQESIYDYNTTSLLNVQATGGAILVGHGFLDDQAVLQVMKHDAAGETSCSDTTTTILEDLIITADTLTSQLEDVALTLDSLDFEFDTFTGFTPPRLTIESTYPPFCPNELIDTFLLAVVDDVAPENITYMWSTGEITDSIRVMAEGQYSVTVTINEDLCYMMCDTIELTRLELPQITISQDDSQFCTEDIIVLNSNYMPGAPIQTLVWNTMETTESIEVTEAGIYAIAVTDECGESATDEIDVSLPVFDPLLFGDVNTVNYCDTQEAIITTSYSGGGNQPIFSWSNGEDTNVISVTENGTYTLTVTDECGFETTFSQVVNSLPDDNFSIEAECDVDGDGNNIVNISYNGGNFVGDLTIVKKLDSGADSIVSQLVNPYTLTLDGGDYEVIVSLCGIEIETLEIPLTFCGSPLFIPIAFFPGGQDPQSSTFGPIPNDTMNLDRISEVDFKVFNRWGETVFESNEILEAWDGSHKDEPAPSEVYIWYLAYTIDGQQMLEKGDVTLIR